MSNRGLPSLTALLGLLAIAGYQNRDKIAELLKGLQGDGGTAGNPTGGGGAGGSANQGGLRDVLGPLAGAGGAGGILTGGLGELLDRFKRTGQGETADSWVQKGPNRPVTPSQLGQAVGDDVMDVLVKQTGLSREELLARLSRALPDAIDKYTPDGRVPTDAEASRA
jgi:uncharacterized protein YidB (DUF937 family)